MVLIFCTKSSSHIFLLLPSIYKPSLISITFQSRWYSPRYGLDRHPLWKMVKGRFHLNANSSFKVIRRTRYRTDRQTEELFGEHNKAHHQVNFWFFTVMLITSHWYMYWLFNNWSQNYCIHYGSPFLLPYLGYKMIFEPTFHTYHLWQLVNLTFNQYGKYFQTTGKKVSYFVN